MNHKDWMRLALEQALIAFNMGEVPIGAVIIRDGEILGAAHNEKETHQDPTAHAEILAIKRAAQAAGSWRLEGASLYVTLEPCPMCAGAIIQARLKQVIFGASDLKGGGAGSVINVLDVNRWNHKVEVISGIEEEDCGQILKSFFRMRR